MSNGRSAAPGTNLEALKPKPPAPEAADQTLDELTSVEADERVRETLTETKDNILHAESKSELEAAKETAVLAAPTAWGAQGVTAVPKDAVIIEVEKLLEEGVGPLFASLPAEAKPLFKKKGEEASREIADMVRSLNVRAKRVLELIYTWLRTIPGVNKFFLEQEAKIKTDRIVELTNVRKEEAMKGTGQ
ncbi:MAG TPA: hypothetical protein VN397_00350 [Candidatus Methylomirabilis sp.]|nr:hypothetical protein [Candidatus Methylomirabilis sp.]